jgi:hypothetical protein
LLTRAKTVSQNATATANRDAMATSDHLAKALKVKSLVIVVHDVHRSLLHQNCLSVQPLSV